MFSLHHGDCLDVLKTFDDNSVDSIVTDPPYGLSFMGKKWDYAVPSVAIWSECLRVLKPGGHLLAFAGTRTQHRMAVNIEDAGFEIRDTMGWVYGSGFPKSHNISIAIDKAAGAEREVVGTQRRSQVASEGWDRPWKHEAMKESGGTVAEFDITAPATPEAQRWDGWGSALKPAIEPFGVYYKPLTVEAICAILLADVTEQIWSKLCQWSNASANDAENLLSVIRATLEKAGAFSVAESARTSALENTESAILAVRSSTWQKRTETEQGTIRVDSAPENARQNGNEADTLGKEIPAGQADAMRTMDTFMSAITDRTLGNTALLWSEALVAALSQANTFTTRMALRLTTELKTLRYLMHGSTSLSTGRSKSFSPAIEPITVARKPFNGTLADNVLRWGTGGINVDGCRVGIESRWNPSAGNKNLESRHTVTPISSHKEFDGRECNGRWPANLIHDGSDEVVALFPETKSATAGFHSRKGGNVYGGNSLLESATIHQGGMEYGDSGSAARFFYAAPPDSDELPIDSADPIFYCAKASKRDRDEGCEELPTKQVGTYAQDEWSRQNMGNTPDAMRQGRTNFHPTVKPTSLMRYLCRLVTPPNGVILDPFCGSGSTGKGAIREGFRFIGIDLSEEYLDIARRRITLAMSQVGIDAETAEPHWAVAPSAEPQPQQTQIAGIIPSQPKQGRLF